MYTDQIFKGKVCIITGGGTGLGRAFALEISRLGGTSVVVGRTKEKLDETVHLIQEKDGDAFAIQVDIRKPEQVKSMVDIVNERLGRIDILVNNAAGNFVSKFENMSQNGWNAVVNIVLNGTYNVTHTVGNYMIEQGMGGKVVNLIAAYAWHGAPGNSHSGAAKAGVLNMTKTLAVEWAPHNIQVNALCPGYIDTEGSRKQLWPTEEIQQKMLNRIPARRFATEEEIAWSLTYLCSPFADYITGSTLVIDGGEWLNKGAFISE
jgi:NAD(P)-dependent dehydrogenase (short-subunit alcohol dehydrogenase family)